MPQMIDRGVSIALPSMKVDIGTLSIIKAVSGVRKSSLTFAVETASDEIRKIVHKRLSINDLLEIVGEVFNNGWKTIKLYFMIGLPGYQKNDEADAIIDLLNKINFIGKKRKNINVTISPFVPKPHTPFQWDGMADYDYFERIIAKIKDKTARNISIKNHDIATSILEGVFSRADEKMGAVILDAYQKGCVLDSWGEYFKRDVWYSVLDEKISDWKSYLNKKDQSDSFPWSIVDSNYEEVIQNKQNEILTSEDLEKLRSNYKEKIDDDRLNKCKDRFIEKYETKERVRLGFYKNERAKYLSHLDMIEVLTRAFRMLKLPIVYSQGFHKREKISAGYPLPLGIESHAELIDLDFYNEVDIDYIKNNIDDKLPEGLGLKKIIRKDGKETIMSVVTAIKFEVKTDDKLLYDRLVKNISKKLVFEKKGKRKTVAVSFDDAVLEYQVLDDKIVFLMSVGKTDSLRIDNLVMGLSESGLEVLAKFKILKLTQYKTDSGHYIEV
jgi:radical SAM-linked protein